MHPLKMHMSSYFQLQKKNWQTIIFNPKNNWHKILEFYLGLKSWLVLAYGTCIKKTKKKLI